MTSYVCEFDTEKSKGLEYRTVQNSFVLAQSAFGSYCARNHVKPIKGWKWRIAGQKTYLN